MVNKLEKISIKDIEAELFKKMEFGFIVDKNGLIHEKQKEALCILTDNTTEEFGYGGAAGGAKAQPLDCLVYTPFGPKRMGDVNVGDVVCHPSGANTNVIAIHPQGLKDVYEIKFSDGAKTKTCGDHLWYCWFASNKSKQEKKSGLKGKIQTTRMLMGNLHKNPIIPLCNPINFTIPKNRFIQQNLIDSYILGVLIGDGSLTKQVSFTSADAFIVAEVKRLLPEGYQLTNRGLNYNIVYNQRNDKGFNINPIRDEITRYGLNCKSEYKFIPKAFLHESLSVRKALIQGLMDTDGTIDKRGHCSFSTSSKQLAIDFQYLVRSIGFKATIYINKTSHLDNYRIQIQGNDCSILFRLPRKLERVRKFNGGVSESGRRIVSIIKVGYVECQCITVDNPDGLYITDDFIVTHNSWTGCVWLLFMCVCYPETRWFIGREELKRLRESTYMTWIKVCKQYGFTQNADWKYNGQDHFIQFSNGSRIDLLDLKYLPSDIYYERYGSSEYTGGWIEEGGEVNFGAYDTLKSRIGRHNNDRYGLTGKLFVTLNPKKNWCHHVFWKPFKSGELPENRKFLQSLVTDNPFIDSGYIDKLKAINDKVRKQRLLFGNFDYDDDDNALMDYDSITDIFSNESVEKGERFITADVARFGKDKTVIGVWFGWRLEFIRTMNISKTTEVAALINELSKTYSIAKSKIVVDDDGVGGGVTDLLECKGFVNGSSALPEPETKRREGKEVKPNYVNLRSQCYFRLAERINLKGLFVNDSGNIEMREMIVEELEQVKKKETDNDRKLQIVSKDEIKEMLGRSPDFADMIMMREYFELKPVKKPQNLSKYF